MKIQISRLQLCDHALVQEALRYNSGICFIDSTSIESCETRDLDMQILSKKISVFTIRNSRNKIGYLILHSFKWSSKACFIKFVIGKRHKSEFINQKDQIIEMTSGFVFDNFRIDRFFCKSSPRHTHILSSFRNCSKDPIGDTLLFVKEASSENFVS